MVLLRKMIADTEHNVSVSKFVYVVRLVYISVKLPTKILS